MSLTRIDCIGEDVLCYLLPSDCKVVEVLLNITYHLLNSYYVLNILQTLPHLVFKTTLWVSIITENN